MYAIFGDAGSEEVTMAISAGVLCFSPTNTTRTICEAVAFGISGGQPRLFDMTLPRGREELVNSAESLFVGIDHLIVGVPVYAGKIPPLAMDTLCALQGDEVRCTAVVVYGNRDYGVALRRLVESLIKSGFMVVSAGASEGLQPDGVPVQVDIFTRSKSYFALKPTYIEANCLRCGICAQLCTAGVISPETGKYTERKKECIGCTACVRACPNEGRVVKTNPIMKIVMGRILGEAARVRKEPLTVVAGK